MLIFWPFSILTVAPRVGAWIETYICGFDPEDMEVAPRVGAWIETSSTILSSSEILCRSPRGSVD